MSTPTITTKSRKARQEIAGLLVDRIDLVASPDNPEAKVALYKRAPDDAPSSEPTQKAKSCPKCQADLANDEQPCPKCGYSAKQVQPSRDRVDDTTKGEPRITKAEVWSEITKAAESVDAPTPEQKIDRLLASDEGRVLRERYAEATPDYDPFEEVGKTTPPARTPVEETAQRVVKVMAEEGEDSAATWLAKAQHAEANGHLQTAQTYLDYAATLS